jgi:hypothetical protein
MVATGYARWFERLLAELGFELWIGDPAVLEKLGGAVIGIKFLHIGFHINAYLVEAHQQETVAVGARMQGSRH